MTHPPIAYRRIAEVARANAAASCSNGSRAVSASARMDRT